MYKYSSSEPAFYAILKCWFEDDCLWRESREHLLSTVDLLIKTACFVKNVKSWYKMVNNTDSYPSVSPRESENSAYVSSMLADVLPSNFRNNHLTGIPKALASPKSASLSSPDLLLMRRFCGFRSRCRMLRLWQ